MKIYGWLPELTSFGEEPTCDNCERFGEDCGHSGWLCGDWKEAEQIQMSLKGERDDGALH